MKKLLQSFLRGMGSVFNLGPSAPSKILSDEEAIRSDWEAVGGDIQAALEAYSNPPESPNISTTDTKTA